LEIRESLREIMKNFEQLLKAPGKFVDFFGNSLLIFHFLDFFKNYSFIKALFSSEKLSKEISSKISKKLRKSSKIRRLIYKKKNR
jgi:hypothetical protein